MHPRTDAAKPASAAPASIDAARRAASSAASADALLKRVAELEATLAAERAQNAARARQVEAGVSVLRKALQDMQSDTKRAKDENARLHEQLEQSRRLVASVTSAQDGDASRLAEVEAALQAARAEADEALRAARAESEEAVRAARAETEEAVRAVRTDAEEAVRAARADTEDVRAELVAARKDASQLRDRVRILERDLSLRVAEVTRTIDRVTELERLLQLAHREAPLQDHAEPVEPRGAPAPTPSPEDELLTIDDPPGPPTDTGTETAASPPGEVLPAAPAVLVSTPAGSTAPVATAPARPQTVADLRAASARNDAEHAVAPTTEQDPGFPQIPGLRIERLVEENAQGRTFDAREIATRRPVVLRLLPGVLKLLDGKRLDSVLLAKHPAIVAVLSFAVCRDGPYLVMERAEGETSTAWVKRIGPLPERIALSVALEAARGLRQAAFHGALHGDLCPDAILVETSGRVRVCGVGLRAVFAQQGDVVRAPQYASPERLRGSPPPDVRSDLYSLGAVLHFLLTGKPPYEGERDAILRQQTANAVPDVREVRNDVSEKTARLVRKLLQSDADLRQQTWDQLLVEFERQVPGRVSTALRGNLATRTRRFLTAHPWVLGAAIAAPLLVAGIWRVTLGRDPTAAERFRDACVGAETMIHAGDLEGARGVYRRFLTGTGDAEVEREAARRFDELTPR